MSELDLGVFQSGEGLGVRKRKRRAIFGEFGLVVSSSFFLSSLVFPRGLVPVNAEIRPKKKKWTWISEERKHCTARAKLVV